MKITKIGAKLPTNTLTATKPATKTATKPATKNKEKLYDRRLSIGASDVPIILGESPYTTPRELWEQKTQKEPYYINKDFDPQNPQLYVGMQAENLVLNWYARKEGLDPNLIKRNIRVVNPSLPYPLAVTLDAVVFNRAKKPLKILQVKVTRSSDWFREVQDPQTGVFTPKITQPLWVDTQEQAEFQATNIKDISVIVWYLPRGAAGLYELPIEINPQKQQEITEKCSYFWQCVQNKEIPDPSTLKEVSNDNPYSSGESIRLDDKTANDVAKIHKFQKEIKLLEQRISTIKFDIATKIKDYKYAYYNGRRLITYTDITTAKVLNIAKVRNLYPQVASKCTDMVNRARQLRINQANVDDVFTF